MIFTLSATITLLKRISLCLRKHRIRTRRFRVSSLNLPLLNTQSKMILYGVTSMVKYHSLLLVLALKILKLIKFPTCSEPAVR